MDGVDAEWIAELEHIDSEMEVKPVDGRNLSATEANIVRMEKLDTVMVRSCLNYVICHTSNNRNHEALCSWRYVAFITPIWSILIHGRHRRLFLGLHK